jgi:hypothetical protein
MYSSTCQHPSSLSTRVIITPFFAPVGFALHIIQYMVNDLHHLNPENRWPELLLMLKMYLGPSTPPV